MAKAPEAGRSKTRLCPPLLPEQAAALSAAFLRDTTESMVAAARLAPIVRLCRIRAARIGGAARQTPRRRYDLAPGRWQSADAAGCSGVWAMSPACRSGHAGPGACRSLCPERGQPDASNPPSCSGCRDPACSRRACRARARRGRRLLPARSQGGSPGDVRRYRLEHCERGRRNARSRPQPRPSARRAGDMVRRGQRGSLRLLLERDEADMRRRRPIGSSTALACGGSSPEQPFWALRNEMDDPDARMPRVPAADAHDRCASAGPAGGEVLSTGRCGSTSSWVYCSQVWRPISRRSGWSCASGCPSTRYGWCWVSRSPCAPLCCRHPPSCRAISIAMSGTAKCKRPVSTRTGSSPRTRRLPDCATWPSFRTSIGPTMPGPSIRRRPR